MKNLSTILFIVLFSMISGNAWAYDAKINGIYYNFSGEEAEVTFNDKEKYIGDIIIPESVNYNGKTYKVTIIGWQAFSNCNISSCFIPSSVKIIKREAFQDCRLTSVTIGHAVTEIEANAFDNCSYLNIVNISDIGAWCNISFGYHSNPLMYSKHLYLNGQEIKELIIPETVTEIKEYSFYNCNFLSVIISNSVTSIKIHAFADCSIQSLTVGSNVLEIGGIFNNERGLLNDWNPTKTIWLTNTPPTGYHDAAGIVNYVSNTNYLFDKKYNTVIYPLLSSMFSTDGVKYVPTSMANRTCEAIDAVYNESSKLTKLGTSVTYREKSFKVDYVHPYTCHGNTFVENLELTDLPFIEDFVFKGCSNLQSVKLPETVEWLGESSFHDCSSLKELTIPAATTEVQLNAFTGCTSMKNVTMNDGVEILTLSYSYNNPVYDNRYSQKNRYPGAPLFTDCPLDKVYIGRKIKYEPYPAVGYSPFYRNTSLREVEITDRETEISENEFYGCTGLKSVKIGDGVTTFGNWAFSDCSSLDYFEFGTSVKTIGKEAFSDCAAVKNIISHAVTPPVCESQAMDDINKWDCTLTVPDGATAAYQAADQWKEFLFTQDYSTYLTDIDRVNINSNATQQVFSLDGSKQKGLRKGINIIRSNGKMKKVLVK